MIVAIPHPTEQLILAKEQKKILHKLNNASTKQTAQNESSYNSIRYVPEFPLWIKFDSNADSIFDSDFFKHKNEKLKSLRKKLKPLAIYNWQEVNGKLFFPVEMCIDCCKTFTGNTSATVSQNDTPTQTIHGEIVFGKKICVANTENHQPTIDSCQLYSKLLIACKIFRIAEAEFETTENGVTSWRVNNFAWIKT